jgi:cold shock CspA family protein
MLTGIIEHLAEESKGYGFIKCEDYEKNLFFHAKDLVQISFNELRKGDAVAIGEVEETPKGYAAKRVQIING